MNYIIMKLLMLFIIFEIVTSQNYVDYEYYVRETVSRCETRYSECCTLYIFCSTYDYQYCWSTVELVRKTGRVCKQGWSYPCGGCNIPICQKACERGQQCTAPDTCTCISSSALCKNVPCSAINNCYPGTCSGGKCSCPAYFDGVNCENSLKIPEITDCTVKVTSESNFVRTFECNPDGIAPSVFWIKASIKELAVNYRVKYKEDASDFPTADFLTDKKFGIISSRVEMKWNELGTLGTKPCPGLSNLVPVNSIDCDLSIRYGDSGGLQPQYSNKNVNFSIVASLGGIKKGVVQGSTFDQPFSSKIFASRSVSLFFDDDPPTHCLSAGSNSDCPAFPIQIDKDLTTNPRIKVTIANWTDLQSGIANYSVAINFLQLNPNKVYSDPAKPLQFFYVQPNVNGFNVDVTATGVYSVVLTVIDLAGNEARARNIFTYSSVSDLKTNLDKPLRCVNCQPESDYKSLTSKQGSTTILKFDWTDHFQSDSNLSLRVEPWPPGYGIDDIPNSKYIYGTRTINELEKNIEFIFNYGYEINSNNTNLSIYKNSTKASTVDITLNSLKEGDVITFYLDCKTTSGFYKEEHQNIVYDTSSINWGSSKFEANDAGDAPSRFYIEMNDTESGIKYLNYVIKDQNKKEKSTDCDSALIPLLCVHG